MTPYSRCTQSTASRTVLLKKARSGQFRTVREAVDWVHREYGVTYTYTGMHALLNRNGGGNARSRAA